MKSTLTFMSLRRLVLALCASFLFAASGCGGSGPTPEAPAPAEDSEPAAGDPGADEAAAEAALQSAVTSEERPEEDRARDAARKPFEVLQFFGIAPGMQVADLMAGLGYYTEILARAVGPEGRVYAQNTPFVIDRFADGPLSERLTRLSMDNIVRIDAEFTELELPAGELDTVLMFLFYHDLYWQGVDRAQLNQAIYDALKPGGVYGIIDHHAEAGSGERDVETIHRVDAALVRAEIEAAGFVLEAESDLLSHPEDTRTANVFDESIRGQTDRFMYRFRKPE
ncbi:class I SAM-dependent methyltransferase [Haliangium ochraceum]|uniref:Methyltransferase n=1 Tax=Haliangium ochraceum (strain DSM 14365 / JCM 11303 / SMP-2) TaxID=502025 RepID=D0LZJ5_HALO1|nr:class I SAM-dependent methyltransferase [Haliangium ochraceum]ACY17974.1 methyltransferase [Haliangium ochraceum DSM 14365]